MTGLAALREASAVGIGMAVRTLAKWNSGIARLIILAGRVALLAAYIRVKSGERIARLRVIEFFYVNRFPVIVVVTLEAVGSQAAFVLVFVTGRTRLRQSKKRAVEVTYLDRKLLWSGYVGCGVAAAALCGSMFAFENVSSLLVVEGLRIPLDKREVFAIVVGVATDALLARAGFQVIGSVEPFSGRNAGGDFPVAIETTKGRFPSRQLVAPGTVGGAVEGRVRAGKWPRRNLGARENRQSQDRRCDEDREPLPV